MRIRHLLAAAIAALGLVTGSAAWAATVVNLGFAIDHSGSMSNAEYTLQKDGLANALALLPTSGDVEYRVSVVTFGNDVKTLVAPTIVTAANLAIIQSAITTHARTNTGATRTGDAIIQLTSLFSPFAMPSTLTLFNISTDGQNNSGANPVTAANAATAAGVNSISIELIGSFGQGVINSNLAIATPNAIYVTNAADLPNATTQGFVFAVANFNDYNAAIGAKVQRIVDDVDPVDPGVIPLPAGLPLLLAGLGAFAYVRRRQTAAA